MQLLPCRAAGAAPQAPVEAWRGRHGLARAETRRGGAVGAVISRPRAAPRWRWRQPTRCRGC